MKTLDWIAQFGLWSRERMGVASRSELRRWFDAGNVVISAERVEWNEEMENMNMISVVIFPKGKRITLL